MQQPPDAPRKSSSQILPLVIAAFAGAILAIACERSPSRLSQEAQQGGATPQKAPAQRTQVAQAPLPTPMPPKEALTDPVITSRIASAIKTDPGMAGSDLTINTDHGVVSLVGKVKSHEQTALASAHAQKQDGVLRVDNQLSVATQ